MNGRKAEAFAMRLAVFHTCSSESNAAVLGDSVHVHYHLLFGNIPTKGYLFTLALKECLFSSKYPHMPKNKSSSVKNNYNSLFLLHFPSFIFPL